MDASSTAIKQNFEHQAMQRQNVPLLTRTIPFSEHMDNGVKSQDAHHSTRIAQDCRVQQAEAGGQGAAQAIPLPEARLLSQPWEGYFEASSGK